MFGYLLQEVEKEEKNLGFSRNSEGATPFLMAAKKGHFQICKLITEEVKAIKKVKDLNIDLGKKCKYNKIDHCSGQFCSNETMEIFKTDFFENSFNKDKSVGL